MYKLPLMSVEHFKNGLYVKTETSLKSLKYILYSYYFILWSFMTFSILVYMLMWLKKEGLYNMKIIKTVFTSP